MDTEIQNFEIINSKYIRNIILENFNWPSLEELWYQNIKITEEDIIKIIYEIRKDVARWSLIKWDKKFYQTVPRYTNMWWDYNISLTFQKKLGITEEQVERYLSENTLLVDDELNKWLENYASKWKIYKLLLVFSSSIKEKCLIKWNISKINGDKIYHLPESIFYNETTIEKQRWERLFCTEEEAVKAWWRKEEATWNMNSKLTPDEEKILEEDNNDQRYDDYTNQMMY